MEKLKEEAKRISSLEIQGATNVALNAIRLLMEYACRIENECKTFEDWKEKLEEAKEVLFKTRETEPAMRNGLNYITRMLEKNKERIENGEILELIETFQDDYKTMIETAKEKIAEIGARRFPDDSSEDEFTVMTHCHSSFVNAILMKATSQGKRFKVIATETQPKLQGRKTVKRLVEAGVKVIHVVDSAMRWAVNNYEVDLILIGADSVTSEGTVLNKIGSRLLALVAHEEHVPFYVATTLLKYNPKTSFGILEKIEMRSPEEVWKNPPKGVKIINPAFETVSRRYIDGLISEGGIFASSHVHGYFNTLYPDLAETF
jgi:ribose 1,5-bisphosphate isomerase